MSKRLLFWPRALDALVRERMNQPFAWGTNDCALFAADCVLEVTGVDPAADVRGTYDSAASAARMLEKAGGVFGLAQARLGPRIAATLAQVGDVAMVQQDGRDVLAVCMGEHALAPGAGGLVWLPMSAAQCAWRCTVGEG